MRWHLSWRADPRGRAIADRHYNRQNIGATQFVPPGRPLVLLTRDARALWVSHWPITEFVKHDWAGAWMCTTFRNEARELYLSSELVREAVAATLARWGKAPDLGMVTFVDPERTHRKRDPGRCFRKAGFREVGRTKEQNLVVLQMLPGEMPRPELPVGSRLEFDFVRGRVEP